jgi:hypothetical protein
MTLKIGDEIPCWWQTFDDRPDGEHKARILAAKPYTGPLAHLGLHTILKLYAPLLKKGYLEMTWGGEAVEYGGY